MTTTTPYVDAFMREALREAQCALAEGEVAVGCVLVHMADNARAHAALRSREHDAAAVEAVSYDAQHAAPPAPRRQQQQQQKDEDDERLWRDCIAACGRNATNAQHHALAHAEFVAVEALLQRRRGRAVCEDDDDDDDGGGGGGGDVAALRDLSAYVLYVTCEPCIMCAAFLLYNRIGHVFYGCRNDRFGGNGSILALHDVHRNRLAAPRNARRCRGKSSDDDDDDDDDDDSDGDGAAAATPPCAEADTLADGGTRGRDDGLWGYTSEGGYRANEAVALLQTFYRRENPHAPGHKRRRKPTA